MDMFNLFSGGALLQCSIGSLGIMPYISASIIIQLMGGVVPHLEKLRREGDVGHQKITQYTRYLTVVLCVIQAFGMAMALKSGRYFGLPADVVRISAGAFVPLTILSIATGSLLLMWIGEQITDRGIGNGISIIITVNIVSRLPMAVRALADKLRPVDGVSEIGPFHLVLMLVLIFFVVLGVVAITQAQQRVPIQFAKRMVGRKMMQGGMQHFPLRVNYSGVMPIIFASAILAIPMKLFTILPFDWAHRLAGSFYGSGWYTFWFALMILFFSYFWVATQFNPVQIADNLKKQGGYVPGIRPGRPTAEYLDRVMTRLTFAGAVFLTIIAVMPNVVSKQLNIPPIVARFFGGTSLLIIVGVMLDTMRQVESHLLMHHYDGFLKKGKLRGRR